MSAEEIVVVKGPLYPDLFDGMSPVELVMTKKEAAQLRRRFIVSLELTASCGVHVVAENEDEARELAADSITARDMILTGDYDLDIVDVQDDGPAPFRE